MPFRPVVPLLLVLSLSSLVAAQTGKKIYLDPDSRFSPYFSAALQKKKVPVTVTMDPKQADYMAQFQARDKNGSIIEGILSKLGQGNYDTRSYSEVVMTIVDEKTKDVSSAIPARSRASIRMPARPCRLRWRSAWRSTGKTTCTNETT